MNNIKELRHERLMSQKELVEAVNLPGFDIPLLSKIENDVCRPTPEAEIRICKALHAHPVELYGEWHQIEIGTSKAPASPDLDMRVTELMSYLPRKKENAIPRFLLAMNMDCSDRQLRKIIEIANRSGVLVGNVGNGYFLIDDIGEGFEYYKQERRRALSKLSALTPLRSWLMEKGVSV